MNTLAKATRVRIHIAAVMLAAILAGLAAITNQSLWMDEGSGAFKALIPNIKDWWAMTLRIGGSDVQMPVYMFLLWLWHQAGAVSEFALRSVNLPWLVIMALALRRVRFWPLVCLCSPFVLYYVGELRPYTMQMAAGALAAAGLAKVIAGKDESGFAGLHLTAGAALLLSVSSLTAAVWAAGAWLGLLIIRTDWLGRKEFWMKILPWIFGSAIIGGYYLFTLLQGYRAAGTGGSSVLSLGFGVYEMLGLMGLGPSRNELRADPKSILTCLPLLLPAILCISGAWFIGFSTWLKTVTPRVVIAIACAVLAPVLVLLVVGLTNDFRILGRHLSPAIPAVLLPIATAFNRKGSINPRGAAVASLAMLFMIGSAAGLRFHERHARDDYRKATAIAIEALQEGKRVWLQADMNATRYYAYKQGGMPFINAIQILESDPPTSLMFTDVVIINRPDLRHRGVDYRAELKRNFFELDGTFTGFEVWSSK